MANVTVSGSLTLASGASIPLQNTSQAEGTEFTLQTNSTYTVTQQNPGDYAPGAKVTHATIQAPNGIAYAYILRQGVIAAVLPVSIKGVSGAGPIPLLSAFTLQPGDQIRVMASTAASRLAAVCVATSKGVHRIFTVTPSGAATNEPTDLQTGNSVGDTLQGQTIAAAFCTSVDGSKIDGAGCLMLNEQGIPIGAPVMCNNPQTAPVGWSSVAIPVALNFKWSIVTTS